MLCIDKKKCKICNKHGIDCKNCFYVKVDEQAGKYFIATVIVNAGKIINSKKK